MASVIDCDSFFHADCACDEVGSLNSSVPCDVSNGTCDCLPGVSGRQCDQCMDMFHNFSSNGCIGKSLRTVML